MSKLVVAVCLLMLGVNAAGALTTDASCALPAIAASAELQDVAGSGLVTVPVTINGKAKRFLLDIGSGASQISSLAVRELGLTAPTRQSNGVSSAQTYGPETGGAAGGQTLQFAVVDVNNARAREDIRPLVSVASFTFGQATGHNLVLAVADDSKIAAGYDGRLTGSFFRHYDVNLDFAQHKISYLTPNSCTDLDKTVFWPHTRAAQVPMTVSDGKITLQVTMKGHPVNAVIDTSFAHTVLRRDVAERVLELKADTPEMTPAGDLHDGQGVRVYRHVLPLVAFADGIAAHDVPVLIQTNPMTASVRREAVLGSRARFSQDARIPDLTIGMDVLRQLHVYVVYGQDSLYVTMAQ